MKRFIFVALLACASYARADIFSGGNPAYLPPPPYVGYAFPGNANVALGVSSDVVFNSFYSPAPFQLTSIRFSVGSGSAGSADVGLYNSAGALLSHSGPITLSGNGIVTDTVTAVSEPAGSYYLALQASNTQVTFNMLQAAANSLNSICVKNTASTMGLPITLTLPGTAGTRCLSIIGLVTGGIQ